MDKNRAKTKEIDEAEAVCATEMTGLISALPKNKEQAENYSEVLRYKAEKNQFQRKNNDKKHRRKS